MTYLKILCLFSAHSHKSTIYICNIYLSADYWRKQVIKIGPKRASIRKGRRNLLFVRGRKATTVITPSNDKAHPTLWSKVCLMKRHFEDWRLVFLRWLNIFVMQFTSDCQRRKKKTGKSIFNLSWKTWSLSLIASTLLAFFSLLSIQEDHWKEGRQKIWGQRFYGSNSWS